MSKHIFWITSYPKSGNTLLRAIISSLFFTNDGKFNFNLNDVMNGKKVMNGGHEYTFNHKNYNKDITTWATEVLWWGRKNKSYEVDIVDLQKTTMG